MTTFKTCALIGNPNTGKSTLFNMLTGGNQRIGNWSGVTVEKKSGSFQWKDWNIHLIDLPGVYSLDSSPADTAPDVRIACEAILSQGFDLIINIVDASNLERNLYLTTQLLEMGIKTLVVANMLDIAQKKGFSVDLSQLAKQLKCPVIGLSENKKLEMSRLKEAIIAACQFPPNAQSLIISSDSSQQDQDIAISTARYNFSHETTQAAITKLSRSPETITNRIDNIVLNRFLGIPFFLGVMYCLFFFSIKVGGFFQPFFTASSDAIFVQGLSQLFTQLHVPESIIILTTLGFGKGINTIISFVPVLGCLFLFLSLLECSGYMARAAFVVDRFMRVMGLPGKAFVPLIVGFGCNVPAILSARTLEHKRDRLLTLMMAPFMSCGARLTIYAVFTAVFFPKNGQNIVFILYLMGILTAILTGFVLQKTLLKGEGSFWVVELPPYHAPNYLAILRLTWQRLYQFLFRAGKLIVPVCFIVSILNAVNLEGQFGTNSENSILAVAGKILTPLFSPMGIHQDNWPATVGLISGVLAKEVVIGTLNTLYAQLGNFSMLHYFNGQIGAMAYLLFILLYFPCISATAAMVRESNASWAFFSVCWATGLAYAVAVIFYQVATFLQHPFYSSIWILSLGFIFAAVIFQIRRYAIKNFTRHSESENLFQSAEKVCMQPSGCAGGCGKTCGS